MSKRIGYYCWAGPDTIRMINLKYFDPPINKSSILSSYDYEPLKKVRENFGVTDYWGMYSWGFSEKSEKEHRIFFEQKIPNFRRANLRLHAYIQGPNLVFSEYSDKNWFCQNKSGQLIPYHRGRKVVCLNNPQFQEYILKKIQQVTNLDVDGIYMDNIQMGQLSIGCYCPYCKKGIEDPSFRQDSVTRFVKMVSDEVHKAGKQFGTNSYDPKKVDLKMVTGVNLDHISQYQDYLLFENYSFPMSNSSTNNLYLNNIAKKVKIPAFVVSYRRGIGHEDDFLQEDFERFLSEAASNSFYACIKGSEYTTNGIWHNLDPWNYEKVHINDHYKEVSEQIKLAGSGRIPHWLSGTVNSLMTIYFESKIVRKIVDPFLSQLLR